MGAGIGGLTEAIALRQQGHNVSVYEQSRMAQEAGAAIHIAPNCNGLLQRLGINPRDHGSVELLGFTEYSASGELERLMDARPLNKMWQHSWDLIHRAHLHSALKELAISSEGKGKPVELHLNAGVQSVDPTNATVTLYDGTEEHGDVVVGADGVHSQTRKAIPGGDLNPFGSGKSAFRFLIPTKDIAADQTLALYLKHEGHLLMWIADDRRLVMYPCAGGTQMNFVAIHPSEESFVEAQGDSWQQMGSKARMLRIFEDFGEQVATLLNLVDESRLKVWTLLDMNKMPSFVHERLAILGDAAHPFLPRKSDIVRYSNVQIPTDNASRPSTRRCTSDRRRHVPCSGASSRNCSKRGRRASDGVPSSTL